MPAMSDAMERIIQSNIKGQSADKYRDLCLGYAADGGRYKRGIFEAIADFTAIFRRDRGEGPQRKAIRAFGVQEIRVERTQVSERPDRLLHFPPDRQYGREQYLSGRESPSPRRSRLSVSYQKCE